MKSAGVTAAPFKDVDACAKGDEGNKIHKAHGVETLGLKPKIYFIPWILINGVSVNLVEKYYNRELIFTLSFVRNGTSPTLMPLSRTWNRCFAASTSSAKMDGISTLK